MMPKQDVEMRIARHRQWLSALLSCACVMISARASTAQASPALGPDWTDHMVIQRDAPIVIEGTANPGETIVAKLDSETASTIADGHGHFAVRFPARGASATPIGIQLSGTTATAPLVLRDVVIGDVWMCSGQSNMEFPVARALDGASVIDGSSDSGVRVLSIAKGTSTVPQPDFATPVQWQVAGPASVAQFSAACYFMARELHQKLGVPIGAIHSSWGGSQIRPWLTPDAGLALYGATDMAQLRQFSTDPLGAVTAFAPRWAKWYADETGGTRPWLAPDALTWHAVPQIGYWNDWKGTPLATHATGTVWLRRQIRLTSAQANAGAILQLGILDDMDMTWVNGRAVGNSFGWDLERNYRVPGSYLHAGINEVMVAITNSYATGGFTSAADHLAWTVASGSEPRHIPLATGWRYAIAPVASYPPRAPWDANGGIGVMYNRMIAPFGHIALKGIAWYQGESDDGIPGYEARLRALITGWRSQFGASTKMLVVQLANYGAPQLAPAASGWATVRDDQRRAAAAEPDSALVTAIDLGEADNIHPANKLAVGHRLALAAQGIPLPTPGSAHHDGASVRVDFTGIEGALVAWSAAAPIGFELCGTDQASCRYANARIEGNSIVLSDIGASGSGLPAGTRVATRVRHGWAANPLINTRDGRGIPLPGFQLVITP